jgi:hypothetical protein
MVVQDPLATIIGGTLEVTLPNLRSGSTRL